VGAVVVRVRNMARARYSVRLEGIGAWNRQATNMLARRDDRAGMGDATGRNAPRCGARRDGGARRAAMVAWAGGQACLLPAM
jgi:hypothetical protein